MPSPSFVLTPPLSRSAFFHPLCTASPPRRFLISTHPIPRASTPSPEPNPVDAESAVGDYHRVIEDSVLSNPQEVEAEQTFPEIGFPSVSIPPRAATGAQALLDDVAERPQYYLNVSGVLLGLVLSVIVLSATMFALDQLPLIPDALRVVGLAYLFWFLGKFLLNGSERSRLQDEIDEFVEVVRGEEGMVLERAGEVRKMEGMDEGESGALKY